MTIPYQLITRKKRNPDPPTLIDCSGLHYIEYGQNECIEVKISYLCRNFPLTDNLIQNIYFLSKLPLFTDISGFFLRNYLSDLLSATQYTVGFAFLQIKTLQT